MKNQFLALLLFAIPQILIAQTTVSGTISENTNWTLAGSPYVINGLITVAQGVTLVIEPGVIIKRTGFTTQGSMWVSGTLIAVGTPSQPIVFTSHRDDSYGGDTNGDGSSTLPAAGDWSNILIAETGGNSQLEYCVFKYGGAIFQVTNVATLQVRGSSPTVSNCLFSNCVRGVGVTHSGNPLLAGNHFEQCTDVPVIKDLTTPVSFENNTFSDNAFSGIGLVPRSHSDSGEIYTLSKADLGNLANAPYIIPSINVPLDGLSIEAGVSLIIEPGVVIKRSGSYAGIQSALTIRGTLIAQGTSTEPIIFTSIRDDEAGGDTNNDGITTSPSHGDWADIKLLGNDGNSAMEYCIFKYGGKVYQVSNIAALQVSNGSPTISNCLFSNCVRGIGVTHSGNPLLSGNHFEQCTDVPVIKDLTTQVSFENNTFSGNAFSGIGLVPRTHSGNGQSFTLSKAGLGSLENAPYIVPSTNVPLDGLSIEAGVSLTIEPGVVIKRSGSYAGVQYVMVIRGTLLAQGSADEPIVFTSVTDDSFGGDSNNDGGATVPDIGEWKGLIIASNSGTSSLLENCIFRFGGDGALTIEGNPTIKHCTFYKCKRGLNTKNSGNASVSDISFVQNEIGLINQIDQYALAVENCIFEKNQKGVYHSSGELSIHNSKFLSNTQYDLENQTASDVDATNNWWGIDNYLQMRLNDAGLNIQSLFDQLDNPAKGKVIYFPCLPPVPGIYSVAPRSGLTLETGATVTFSGYRFSDDTAVYFQKEDKIITPSSIVFIDTLQLQATFDLTNNETGIYDVIIHDPGMDTLTLTAGFSVLDLPGIPFDEWVPFEVTQGNSFSASVIVPQNASNLFMFIKKSNRLGYSSTWNGGINLSQDYGELLQEADEDFNYLGKGNDIDFQDEEPSAGAYFFEIKTFNEAGKGYVKFAQEPDKLTLGQWATGEILRPYGFDWKYIDVPANTASLYIRTEGFGLWSTITLFHESINLGAKTWTFQNWGNGYHIEGIILNPPPGRYYIRYKDSAVLQSNGNNQYDEQVQKREYLIQASTTPISTTLQLPLSISGLSNTEVGQGNVTIDIFGTGFSSGDSIFLEKSGSPVIVPEVKSLSILQEKWTVSFNLTDADPGEWGVKINNGVEAAQSPHNLLVTSDLYADVECNLIASTQIRAGRWRPVIIEIENKGNTDAWFVPVFLRFSGIPQIKDDLGMSRIFSISDTLAEVNWSNFEGGWNDWNDVPPYFSVTDSATNETYTYLPFFLPRISSGSKTTLEINIKYLQQGDFSIDLNLMPPIFSGDEVAFRSRTAEDCISEIGEQLLKNLIPELVQTFLPDVEPCFNAFMDSHVDIAATTTEIIASKKAEPTAFIDYSLPILSSILECTSEIFPKVKALKVLKKTVEALSAINTGAQAGNDIYEACFEDDEVIDEIKSLFGQIVNSMTPEDKFGIIGAEQENGLMLSDRKNFINKVDKIEYRIDYWNSETASAPAAEVFIRDTLDFNFDLETFNFTEIGFLRWQIPLDGGHYFNVNVDMRPDYNYIVNVEGTLNPFTREVYWVHRTLDPETFELPDDPQSGYLPPIDPEGYFIGWVGFSVSPFENLASGTVFENQARVNFDGIGPWGPAPPYGPYKNTYDFDAPESQILPTTIQLNDTTLLVSWSGNDGEGCGIGLYDIYASQNGEPFEVWLRRTPQTSGEFTGDAGYEYCFYSIAIDKVGNTEEPPDSPDYCAQISSLKERQSSGYELFQNAPNPFGNKTTIGFKIPTLQNVKILAYNQLGHFEIIADGKFPEGIHQLEWTPENSGSSIYFYQMITSDFTDTKKMIFHK